MQDELQAARQALNERKLIEKAKGLLMQHRQLTEEQAWRQLRQAAMEQNRRLVDVAERVIGLIGILQVNVDQDADTKNAR
jgi:AmiR/NasT family two-component response regulator